MPGRCPRLEPRALAAPSARIVTRPEAQAPRARSSSRSRAPARAESVGGHDRRLCIDLELEADAALLGERRSSVAIERHATPRSQGPGRGCGSRTTSAKPRVNSESCTRREITTPSAFSNSTRSLSGSAGRRRGTTRATSARRRPCCRPRATSCARASRTRLLGPAQLLVNSSSSTNPRGKPRRGSCHAASHARAPASARPRMRPSPATRVRWRAACPRPRGAAPRAPRRAASSRVARVGEAHALLEVEDHDARGDTSRMRAKRPCCSWLRVRSSRSASAIRCRRRSGGPPRLPTARKRS